MIKPDHWIRRWAEAGGVDPYEQAQINAASYDVRLSDHGVKIPEGPVQGKVNDVWQVKFACFATTELPKEKGK